MTPPAPESATKLPKRKNKREPATASPSPSRRGTGDAGARQRPNGNSLRRDHGIGRREPRRLLVPQLARNGDGGGVRAGISPSLRRPHASHAVSYHGSGAPRGSARSGAVRGERPLHRPALSVVFERKHIDRIRFSISLVLPFGISCDSMRD